MGRVMNIEELKRIVTGVLPDNWSYDGMVEYHKEVTPAVVLELIRQRDELLAAMKEIRTLGHNYTQVSHRVWKIADAAIANAEKTT